MSNFIESRAAKVSVRVFATGFLAVSLVGGLSGCGGAEKATPVAAPVGAAPGGASPDDYAKHMKEAQQQRSGGATAPPSGK